ncbi:MAG TPA: P1 family peptidase [Candidatus Polarisedimenticolia bacterium]|nr:P1 family peptidase [Candidatus Polarisedimenticolia bacterium]
MKRPTRRRLPALAAWLAIAAAAAVATPVAAPKSEPPRQRLRDLGIVVGTLPPGPLNAITDVAGVRVGQVTINKGEGKLVPGKGPARTGVTAILPHGGDLWREKVPAATWVLNGTGEMTGSIWINTQGALEVPILLTNTMNVGRVMDGVVAYMLKHYPDIGIGDDVVAPTVAECDDSTLNDARGLHVSVEDTVRAIESAKEGPVEEGAVGAGTGMISYRFKGGIGTSSRRLAAADGGWTVGVLVNANMGRRQDLMVAGVPVGRAITDLMPKEATDGSIIIVVATDAPLDHLKLQRLAARAGVGLARTGTFVNHGSGDLVVAFSTGNRVPHYPKAPTYTMTVVPDNHLDPIFSACAEATEEAILNALTMARTTIGRDGNTAYALPLDRLRDLVARRAAP